MDSRPDLDPKSARSRRRRVRSGSLGPVRRTWRRNRRRPCRSPRHASASRLLERSCDGGERGSHARSPNAASRSVDPTISVNSTVDRTVSNVGCGRLSRRSRGSPPPTPAVPRASMPRPAWCGSQLPACGRRCTPPLRYRTFAPREQGARSACLRRQGRRGHRSRTRCRTDVRPRRACRSPGSTSECALLVLAHRPRFRRPPPLRRSSWHRHRFPTLR